LFELMTENKGLYQEELIRTRILTHLKKGLDTADEITDILDQYDIDRIDAMYIKKMTIKRVNEIIKDKLLNAETGEMITAEEQAFMVNQEQMTLKELYYRMEEHAISLESRLSQEICINENYSDFFNKHPDYCNWMRDHHFQFQAFKNSPYYIKSFPQVAQNKEQ